MCKAWEYDDDDGDYDDDEDDYDDNDDECDNIMLTAGQAARSCPEVRQKKLAPGQLSKAWDYDNHDDDDDDDNDDDDVDDDGGDDDDNDDGDGDDDNESDDIIPTANQAARSQAARS